MYTMFLHLDILNYGQMNTFLLVYDSLALIHNNIGDYWKFITGQYDIRS